MKKVIRNNINLPYSLHDMNVTGFEITDKDLIMRLQYGMNRVTEPRDQVDGHIEFYNLDFDFCHVYIFDITVNKGDFKGEKLSFLTFVERYKKFGFGIVDEVYGYNQSHFKGHLYSDEGLKECIIELSHLGDMVYVEEV